MIKPISAAAIASGDLLLQPVLSPDGSRVLYRVRPQYRAPDKEHWTSALWIADVERPDSARQLTSGLFNDYDAVFSPDGLAVVFLSDRHKAGGSAQIYFLPLSGGGEAYPLTSSDLKRGVQSFKFSLDGRYIAFASADEPSPEEEAKEKRKDDAIVWSEKKLFSRLRMLSILTRTITTFNLPTSLHVSTFTWSPDGQRLLVCMALHSRLEQQSFEARYYTVSIRDPTNEPQLVTTYQDALGDSLTWLSDESILEIRFYNTRTVTSARCVAKVSAVDTVVPRRVVYSGVEDDAQRIVDLNHDDLFAVEILSGLSSRIDIVRSSGVRLKTVYETDDDALNGWDIKRLSDGSLVFACLRSSGPRKEAWNVWAGKINSSTVIMDFIQLSKHNKWQEEYSWSTRTEVFHWTARDGTKLAGLISSPTTYEAPFPTVLIVHGGPYSRDTPALNLTFSNWHAYLSSAGFCVISPNYRGSSGRGSAFAETMRSGVGTVDWTDCEDMVDAAVARGIADPQRLGIGGWSQGGFMTAWGVSQTKNRFKAGCMGAGVSDWGAMCSESDMPDFENELGGSPPWSSEPHKRNDPINYVQGVETSVLILHGGKDERCPVGQAVGYFRGLKRQAKNPERCDLVIYPREPHGFIERSHAEDVLKRVLDHFTLWLS